MACARNGEKIMGSYCYEMRAIKNNRKKNRKKEVTIFQKAHEMKFVEYERKNMENENRNSNKIDTSLRRAKRKIEKYGAIIRNE